MGNYFYPWNCLFHPPKEAIFWSCWFVCLSLWLSVRKHSYLHERVCMKRLPAVCFRPLSPLNFRDDLDYDLRPLSATLAWHWNTIVCDAGLALKHYWYILIIKCKGCLKGACMSVAYYIGPLSTVVSRHTFKQWMGYHPICTSLNRHWST